MTRFRYGTAVIVATAFLISGCGGASGSSESVARDESATEAAVVPELARPQADSGGGSGAGADAIGETKPASSQKTRIVSDPRAVIYTAQLTVRVKDVSAAAEQAKQIVTGAGGYVSEERSNSFAKRDEAVVTFKIPPTGYPDVLARLGRDLGKRESLHQGAQDVTEEVADVASRVKSAESALNQFRTLLRKAEKIGEILEIEREISNREAELESLQARQKALASQTGMATVTLSLAGPKATVPKPKPKESGFFAGLEVGWKTLVRAVGIGLTVLGALLPWLVLAALVGLPFVLVHRRNRARRAASPGAAQPGSAAPAGSAPRPGETTNGESTGAESTGGSPGTSA